MLNIVTITIKCYIPIKVNFLSQKPVSYQMCCGKEETQNNVWWEKRLQDVVAYMILLKGNTYTHMILRKRGREREREREDWAVK